MMIRHAFMALALAFVLSACGYPGKSLNQIEKTADIEWVFGTFERNYAPATWKEKKHGISLAQAKQDCLAQSTNISEGDEFISLLSRCVNRFQDAHTRTMAGGQLLPEMIKVAFLGFRTELVRFDAATPPPKDKDGKDQPKDPNAPKDIQYAIKVTKMLPSTKDADFPVKEGDLITKVNGINAKEYLSTELMPYGNLGNELSSLTIAGQMFALRDSASSALPKEEDVKLEINRGGKIITLTLPWNIKDLLDFQKSFEEENKENKEAKKDSGDSDKKSANAGYWVGGSFLDDMMGMMTKYRKGAGARVDVLLGETFRVFNYSPVLNMINNASNSGDKKKTEVDPFDAAISPMQSIDISKEPFQARVVLADDGSRFGFIRIDSFSLVSDDVKVFKSLLDRMNKMQVKGLILDLLNNGGGSLEAGLDMANALTEKTFIYPSMQMALNDHWLNSFRADSIYGDSETRKTLAGRVYQAMKADSATGARISRPFSSTELSPFILNANKGSCVEQGTCLKSGTKMVLLVNEMCASMCDIFASSFKDNQLGTIVGSQTMGAGGNVVMHGFSPVTQIMLSQTESLVVDANGEYIENQGVMPNVAIDTLLDKSAKYSATYKKALEILK